MSHGERDAEGRFLYAEFGMALFQILRNQEKQEMMMTALDDELASIKGTLDTTLATVGTIKTGVESLLAKLTALQTSGGALTPAQQTMLDGIRDEAVSIAQAASNVNTEANPAPAAAPQGSQTAT